MLWKVWWYRSHIPRDEWASVPVLLIDMLDSSVREPCILLLPSVLLWSITTQFGRPMYVSVQYFKIDLHIVSHLMSVLAWRLKAVSSVCCFKFTISGLRRGGSPPASLPLNEIFISLNYFKFVSAEIGYTLASWSFWYHRRFCAVENSKIGCYSGFRKNIDEELGLLIASYHKLIDALSIVTISEK